MIKEVRKSAIIFMITTLVMFIGCATSQKSSDPYVSWNKNKENILKDKEELLTADFKIPPTLKHRVSFWLDIYGRYDSSYKVIHDSKYPWIVYEVVNTKGMKRSDSFISKRLRFYRNAVKNVAKNKSKLNDHEKRLKVVFKNFPHYIKQAHRNIRSQTGQRDHMKAGINRSMPYLPHMEEIFQERNLPVELTRLPFVESSFNWKAHSKVGARGIWQFMKRTGRKFMKINRYVDERVSPIKSTHAAAKLLKQNHQILGGHWPLAITAYNHGPAGVKKASKRVGSTDMGLIADNYRSRRFSFASANFYSSFLAALYVEKYKDMIFNNLEYKKAPQLLAEKTKKRVRARKLVKTSKLSNEDFFAWNPDLKWAHIKNYRVPRNFIYYKPVKEPNLAYKESTEE